MNQIEPRVRDTQRGHKFSEFGSQHIHRYTIRGVHLHSDFEMSTLQMFTGIYGGPAGKLECGDFRIAGFTCIPAFSINSVGVPFMDFAGKL